MDNNNQFDFVFCALSVAAVTRIADSREHIRIHAKWLPVWRHLSASARLPGTNQSAIFRIQTAVTSAKHMNRIRRNMNCSRNSENEITAFSSEFALVNNVRSRNSFIRLRPNVNFTTAGDGRRDRTDRRKQFRLIYFFASTLRMHCVSMLCSVFLCRSVRGCVHGAGNRSPSPADATPSRRTRNRKCNGFPYLGIRNCWRRIFRRDIV